MKMKLSEMQIYMKVDLVDDQGKEVKMICAGKNDIYLKAMIDSEGIKYFQFENFDAMKEFIHGFQNGLSAPNFH